MKGWNLAEKDNFIEPFIEHHGLLRGLLEACIRKSNPDMYRRITEGGYLLAGVGCPYIILRQGESNK